MTKTASTASKKTEPAPAKAPDRSVDTNVDIHQFADVISGEHKGRYGAVVEIASRDKDTGLPDSFVLRTRDDNDERLVVSAEDLRPAIAGKR